MTATARGRWPFLVNALGLAPPWSRASSWPLSSKASAQRAYPHRLTSPAVLGAGARYRVALAQHRAGHHEHNQANHQAERGEAQSVEGFHCFHLSLLGSGKRSAPGGSSQPKRKVFGEAQPALTNHPLLPIGRCAILRSGEEAIINR